MDNIRVLSFNVRGLRSKQKRIRVFRTLKEKKCDVICLQETYVVKNDFEQWKKEWGGEMMFFEGTNHGRGQIILLRKNFPWNWSVELLEDRLIGIRIKGDQDQDIYVLNVYAPCGQQQTKEFILKTNAIINEIDAEIKIVCGDFNTVLSNEKDIISGKKHPQSLVQAFNTFLNESELHDIWRIYNPDCKEYTWSRKTGTQFVARRLDYILLNEEAVNRTIDTELFSTPYSDHRGVLMDIKCSDTQRGPGYYKFNNLLLKDKAFVSKMNETIDTFLMRNQDENPDSKLELLKMVIREESIQYSKQAALKKRNVLATLFKDLNNVESALSKDPDNIYLQHENERLKLEIEIIEQERINSSKFRAKQLYIDHGDKPSKYFLNLEKHRAGSKLLPNLELENGEIVRDQFEILKAQREYYKHLYSKDSNHDDIDTDVQHFLNACNVPVLEETHRESCEGLITIEEASVALKMMNNGSSPGLDGLTTEFYKCFWLKLREIVTQSFNESYTKGSLSFTQSSAALTLLHKGKDLPKNKLQNWRPISLTNTDYKILAKCLANRVCKVIDHIVAEDQVGYIKGRNISTTIRTIDDVIDYCNLKNKPGILLALDFQKAFDSISKRFMQSAFRRFGFGNNFLNWVKVLFKDTRSCIIYNGWVSEDFDVKCGIRQGCPFSPLAFIIGVELLAIRIRDSVHVKGLTIDSERILKVLLYADDITVFLQNEDDVRRVLMIIDDFSKISDLRLNKKKSEAMGIGRSKNARFHIGFKWVQEIKILGIYFSNTKPASQNERNWITKIASIKQLIVQWEKRNLSLLGKICVIKTFMLSQLVHVMQSICIPEKVLKEVNTLLYRFLWRKKDCNRRAFEKVKRVVVNAEYEKGGIQMIDVVTMQESFMCKWISNLLTEVRPSKWSWIPAKLLQYCGKQFACLSSTIGPARFKGLEHIESLFWKRAVTIWLTYNKTSHLCSSKLSCIWNNDKVTYQGNVLFFSSWTKHFTFVNDMLDSGTILSFESVERMIGPSANLFLQYVTVKTAISSYLRYDRNIDDATNTDFLMLEINKIPTAKSLRNFIVNFKYVEPYAKRFWEHNFNIVIVNNIWKLPLISSKESRLRELQWKILHNIYPTSILLSKMGLKDNNVCAFCDGNVDYIEHFFFYCPKINILWSYVADYFQIRFNIRITFTAEIVLLGLVNKTDLCLNREQWSFLNHLIMIGKMCISKYKYGTPCNLNVMLYRELQLRRFPLY